MFVHLGHDESVLFKKELPTPAAYGAQWNGAAASVDNSLYSFIRKENMSTY